MVFCDFLPYIICNLYWGVICFRTCTCPHCRLAESVLKYFLSTLHPPTFFLASEDRQADSGTGTKYQSCLAVFRVWTMHRADAFCFQLSIITKVINNWYRILKIILTNFIILHELSQLSKFSLKIWTHSSSLFK